MNANAERLLAYLLAGAGVGEWPLPAERKTLERLNTWRAIHESDRDKLQAVAKWDGRRLGYRVDPLGERIAEAWASFLHGEDPTITPAAERDTANYEELVKASSLPSELERAGGIAVAEGEIWPRLWADETVADRPLLDWVSRRNVVPHWVGSRLDGAAIVTELEARKGDTRGAVIRHFELHTPGRITNVLYVGRDNRVGIRRDLDEHPATAGLEEEFETGLPGLATGRIPNKLRGSHALGVSEYAGILDFILDLNEAAVIGAHNARLTARKRVVVQASALRKREADDLEDSDTSNAKIDFPRPRFDAAEEVFVDDPLDRELGRESKDPVRVLEYTFDAQALIDYKRDLVETALSRIGMTGQYVGNTAGEQAGYAISGTALRLRLIPTTSAGRSKARYWHDGIPTTMHNLARLDSNVFGHGYADLGTPPTYTRRPGIPVDEVEEAARHQVLVGAGLESRRTAIEALHPDWDRERVEEELARLEAEPPAAGAGMLGAGF